MKLLSKITPAYDKLKHAFFGTLIFIVASLFVAQNIAFMGILIGSVLWEAYHYFIKPKYKRNSLKEMVLDVFYSNIINLLILLFI
ncbi:hypothetical protein [Flavobacteriaceae bacterium 14752]|uniref:hypothetical protein n=1 Tax=Mesohalobacter salilacus TaxID=2491711 RepID=UPI000F63A799|nr:hypothetical protein EIG84_05915 [Flavobacteriaceae bacterium 14752]